MNANTLQKISNGVTGQSSNCSLNVGLTAAVAIIFCFFYLSGSYDVVNITGWIVITFISLLLLTSVINTVRNINKKSASESLVNAMKTIRLWSGISWIFTIGIPIFLYIIYKNYSKIDNMSDSPVPTFSIFNTSITFLLIMQVFVFYQLCRQSCGTSSSALTNPKLLSSIIFLIFCINMGLSVRQYINVTSFITDG